MMSLLAVLRRLLRRRRRRRRTGPQDPRLAGTRWGGVWQGIPHRPLRPEDEAGRREAVEAAPRAWLARRPRIRW